MRMLKVLLAGWVVGAGVLIALSAMARDREARAAVAPSPVIVAPVIVQQVGTTTPRGGILIPVRGISADQLRDTFTEPRGGGDRVHRAMDILAAEGTPVIAAVDGTVRKLFNSRAGGLTIYQFDVEEETVYYYAHLQRYADGIAEGLFVKQGTVIGYVGITGNAGATPHLHFSIERLPPTKEWWKGDPVNPYPILRGSLNAASGRDAGR